VNNRCLLASRYTILFLVAVCAFAQGNDQGDRAVLVKLDTPVYPRLAQFARVAGSIIIEVKVLPDGMVSSVRLISGPPLLRDAAIQSAEKSKFECRQCRDSGATVSLAYTFSLREDVDCGIRRVRALKCAYLWKCGGYRRNYVTRPTLVTKTGNQITVVADSVCSETSSGRSSQASLLR
jgi:TonB family protein